ncbi:hypothetical protein BEH94_00920 [Candidatus Altiarchaeales archaeon WOR_SM1_SCG]|nr:hypothetical protein BEH94_00920 [Candidatus Altiarchaeales archaeon WOR_SM1_SCG]
MKQKILLSIIILVLSATFACNVSSLSEEWEYSMNGEVRWVYADDLDNDGEVEILVHAFRKSGIEEYSVIYIFNKEGKITGKIDTNSEIFDVQVMDFDNDLEKEIITAAGGLEKGDMNKPYGSVRIFNKQGDVELDYNIISKFRSVYAADLDNDSRNEILAASGYEIVTHVRKICYCDVYALNKRLGLEWKFKAHEDRILIEEYTDIYAEDLDNARDSNNKTHKEIITSTSRGIIYVLRSDNVNIDDYGYATKNNLRWNYTLDGVAEVYATDLDNPLEMREKTGYPCDIDKLNETEKLEKGRPMCYECAIGSCDDKCDVSCREVIASSAGGTVYVFQGNGTLRWSYKTGGRITGTSVSDIDNDGRKEIIVGSDDVYVLDNNGKLLMNYKTQKKVLSVHTADLNNDNIKEIISGTDDGLYIIGIDGTLYEKMHASNIKSVYSSDIDGDGIKEIIAGIGWSAYIFKTNQTILYERSAEMHYKIARDYYEKENYNTALIYANKSREQYTVARIPGGISKSEEFMSDIENKIYIKLKEDEAGEYLEIAQFYYNLSNQTYATNQTVPKGIADSIADKITQMIKVDEKNLVACEINGTVVNATPEYCAGEYAKLARAIYLELGYEDMVNLTDSMIPGSKKAEVNETTGNAQVESAPEEKDLIKQLIDRELKFFGIPALYLIIPVVFILIVRLNYYISKRRREKGG